LDESKAMADCNLYHCLVSCDWYVRLSLSFFV